MIYLITGQDFTRAQNTFQKYVAIFRAKQPEASIFEFTPEDFNPGEFKEAALGQTLFVNKQIILARRLSESEEAGALITGLIKDLAASSSVFLFYEPETDSDLAKKLAKHAKEVKIFETKEKVKTEFNIFTLTEALGERDREKLWVLYQRAERAGIKSGEVFWKLVWQVKNMIVASTAKDPQSTNLKPFVFSKALKASRNFSLSELKNLANNLANLLASTYPESEEFNAGLEKIVLTI